MKNPIGFLVLVLLAPVVSFSAAPQSLAGMLYVRSTDILAAGDARSSTRLELLLRMDGIYVGLLRTTRGGFSNFVPQYTIPANGQWSYRRIDDVRGELTLDGDTKIMTFLTDSSGSTPPSTFLAVETFTITPYDASTPLTNCSNRSFVRSAGSAFTGFVVANANRNRLLVRAIGPSLRQFGVTGALARPVLAIAEGSSNTIVAQNAGWADAMSITQAGMRVGAFSLLQGSADSALLISLPPGAYVAHVSSAEPNDSGEVLVEVYVLP